MLENTKGAIKWIIQRNWRHRLPNTITSQKHNTIYKESDILQSEKFVQYVQYLGRALHLSSSVSPSDIYSGMSSDFVMGYDIS
jgi:hypothetical protein